MDIQDVLIEMRWCRWWPTAQGWADAIEAAMREKDAVIAKLGNGYAETGRVLDAKDAEIERLREVITEASEAMRDGSDSTARAILVAALANKEEVK